MSSYPEDGDLPDPRADESSAPSAIGDALRTTVLLLALGAVLLKAWGRVSRTHQRRRHGRSAPLPERLQTWEGEGGRPIPEEHPAAADTSPATASAASA